MSVDLKKVEEKAPHLVNLVKEARVNLDKRGLDPDRYKAAVVGTFDFSGSTEYDPNHLYSDGTMQRVSDIAFAAGLLFDDDGQMPVSLFHNSAIPLGDVTLDNCRGFIANAIRGRQMGGTSYESALRWIIQEAGFGRVDLGGSSGGGRRGFFGRGSADSGLSVKATAQYPTYALFVTDGEPQDPVQATELLRLMSQLPIFVQFIGVGHHHFQFLKGLDNLDGRLIDNANFFDAKEAGNDQHRILELMLAEFPDYYAQARRQGLLG